MSAAATDPNFAKGINVMAGKVTYAPVAESFDMAYTPLSEVV